MWIYFKLHFLLKTILNCKYFVPSLIGAGLVLVERKINPHTHTHTHTHKELSPLASDLRMKDVNMCQKLHAPRGNEMHIPQKHPPRISTVNEEMKYRALERLSCRSRSHLTALLFQELRWNLLVISSFLHHSLHVFYASQWIFLMSSSQKIEHSLHIHILFFFFLFWNITSKKTAAEMDKWQEHWLLKNSKFTNTHLSFIIVTGVFLELIVQSL